MIQFDALLASVKKKICLLREKKNLKGFFSILNFRLYTAKEKKTSVLKFSSYPNVWINETVERLILELCKKMI